MTFHWVETASADGVPESLVEVINPREVAMRGTNQSPSRCIAFEGDPGASARCGIYERRPTPCRALTASFEDGRRSDQCERARLRHGLAALTPADWPAAATPSSIAETGIEPVELAQ